MADDSSDILMRVVRKGKAIAGEGQSVLREAAKATGLDKDFEEGKFFEVEDFSFDIGSSDKDSHRKLTDEEIEEYKKKYGKPPPPPPPASAKKSLVVDVGTISFSRQMDSSSAVLFDAMVKAETLDSLSIVKRKAAGTKRSGEAYLRLDFTQVLLIGMDLSDAEETVEETWRFIARKVEMKFRNQADDGSLGPVIPGSWTMST